jgi:hypothetical protein
VSLGAGPDGTSGMGTRVTNEEGRFLFRDVPPGSYRLSVTILGYQEMADTLRVPPGADLDLVLPLSAEPIRLEPILVEAERLRPAMRDFENRRRTRHGTFITREEIEAQNAFHLTDLLRMVPGGRIAPAGRFERTLLLRGGCRPDVWIDQVRISSVDSIDQLMSPMDVEAIEVYHGVELPVEFGSNPCGAVVVWTRVGEPAPSRPGFWRRLAYASGLTLLLISLREGPWPPGGPAA